MNRDKIWSAGIITPSVRAAAESGRIHDSLVKEIGDIAGCPIPDIVSSRLGMDKAFRYLFSLATDYNLIKRILEDHNIAWKSEWGKPENRTEPLGEYGSRIPEKFRQVVKGPGKYTEFCITRLLWLNKNSQKRISDSELENLVISSSSPTHLQVALLTAMAAAGHNLEELSEGICHEGFFRQNNCFAEIRHALSVLQASSPSAQWAARLERKAKEILAQDAVAYS